VLGRAWLVGSKSLGLGRLGSSPFLAWSWSPWAWADLPIAHQFGARPGHGSVTRSSSFSSSGHILASHPSFRVRVSFVFLDSFLKLLMRSDLGELNFLKSMVQSGLKL
jgi:hypothetical protein